MKRVFKSNHGGAAGVAAGNLDGILDGFGAAIGKESLLGKVTGRELIELFGKRDVRLVHRDVKTGVREVLNLIFDCIDNFRRGRANIQTTKTAGKIYVGIAVDILDNRAARRLNKYRRDVEWATRDGVLPSLK